MTNLLLVSGWAHDAASLAPLAAALEATQGGLRAKIVSLHAILDGQGSIEEAVARFADSLAARRDPFWLGGWSTGGLLALDALARVEGRAPVRGLVLISATARFCATEGYPCGVPPRHLRGLALALRRRPREALTSFFRDAAAPHALEPDALARAVDTAMALGEDALQQGLTYLDQTDLREAATKLEQPLLLMHGREDAVIPCAAAEWLHADRPGRRLWLMENMGHDLPLRHPGELAEPLAAWLNPPPSPSQPTA